ncbi:MAG: tail fiber domain-containing protein [Candidatus Aminicenantes bacterium]|nr:MAG: tail fiber domain-containing protein [Candidatus Aminicenantes bacterium]
MNKMKEFSLTSSLAVLILCFIGTSAVSASTGKAPGYKPVADEMIEASGITWLAKVDYVRLVLSVAKPDGTVIEKTFESGSNPHLNLSDLLGGKPGDGSYTYELRLNPSAGQENPRRKTLTQTGYFLVQDGLIKVPTIPREGISRAQSPDPDCFDEVVIEGTICVGSGCECEPIGGTDEIIFKGVAPLILLDDTRGTPTSYNSWRINCNDAGDGTGYFAIEDKQDLNYNARVFTLEADAPANSLYVDKNGRVGIGTSTPQYPLVVSRTGSNAKIFARRTDGASVYMMAADNFVDFGTTANYPLRLIAKDWKMKINTNGTLLMRDGGSYNGTWNPASSGELKENIENLTTDEAIEALVGLNPVKYNYKAHKNEARVGFIAEDVPELVAMNSKKTLGTVDIMAVLTKVVQEQQRTISELKDRIAVLEKK